MRFYIIIIFFCFDIFSFFFTFFCIGYSIETDQSFTVICVKRTIQYCRMKIHSLCGAEMKMYQPDDRDFTLKQIFMFCLFLFVFFNAVGCRDFVD